MARTHRMHAFTLIELLVAIAIVSVLLSMLMPSLSAARERATSARCLSNLKGIGAAFSMYAADYEGRIIGGYDTYTESNTFNPWYKFYNGTIQGQNTTTGQPYGSVYFTYLVGNQTPSGAWNAGIGICPKMDQNRKNGTDPGIYGLFDIWSNGMSAAAKDAEGFVRYTKPSTSLSFPMRFLNRIQQPADLMLLADSSGGSGLYPNGVPLNFGCYKLNPCGIMTSGFSTNNGCTGTVWMTHGTYPAEWANGLFADMHAEACDGGRLLSCANTNGAGTATTGLSFVRTKGVSCWKDSSNCMITYNNSVTTGKYFFH